MLTNRAPAKFGNVDILVGNEPPVDSPRTAALEIGGMSGGAGCRIGEGCWDDSDCLSGDCDDSKHCAVKAPADQHESTGGDQP